MVLLVLVNVVVYAILITAVLVSYRIKTSPKTIASTIHCFFFCAHCLLGPLVVADVSSLSEFGLF